MARPGSCAAGCSERKLVMVRAAAHDSLLAPGADAQRAIDVLAPVCEQASLLEAGGRSAEAQLRRLRTAAREALRSAARGALVSGAAIDLREPSEPATAWWCPDCGGLEAPQPCLGICLWRRVEWVDANLYESQRQQVLERRAAAERLRSLARRLAYSTPRPGAWEENLRALQREAIQRRLARSGLSV